MEGTKNVVMSVVRKVRGKIQCTAQINQNFQVLNLILVLLHSYELNLKPRSVEGSINSPWGGGGVSTVKSFIFAARRASLMVNIFFFFFSRVGAGLFLILQPSCVIFKQSATDW